MAVESLRVDGVIGCKMLERLLEHLRYTATLKACSEQARHPAERSLFMTLAAVHEAKTRKLIQRVKQTGLAEAVIEKVPERGHRDPAAECITRPVTVPHVGDKSRISVGSHGALARSRS
ncbi:hypothetical protein ASF08_13075 [Methylobacterium sp. Leaf85]|nr:hypothetical protein ASF08_13075 [Methylobacterium sp. Leaf85]